MRLGKLRVYQRSSQSSSAEALAKLASYDKAWITYLFT